MDHPQLRFINEFDAMRSGVYIATSEYESRLAGCTCVWVTRASFDPPLVAVVFSPVRHTFQTIEKSRAFCLNVMGASGLEQARYFGFHSGHLEDKFHEVDYRPSPSGNPLLSLAVAYLDCRVHDISTMGDHRLVIGEVVAAATISQDAPLVYNPGQFYQQQTDRIESAHA